MAAPCIYEHAHDAAILRILTTQLPYSISLLRRIQHGIAHPSATAKILTTFPAGGPVAPDTPWLAARVDLFRGRETQILIYSSLEPSTTDGRNDYIVSGLVADQPALAHARSQLLTLLAYIKAHLLPLYLSSLDPGPCPAPAQTSVNNATPLIPAPDPHAFLIGTLHAGLFTLLLRDGPLPGLKIHRVDNPPYLKFFFRRAVFDVGPDLAAPGVPLPTGYRYRDRRGRDGVLSSQLDLVQSRTHIPRSRAQLSVMPGVAIYWDPEGSTTDTTEDSSQSESETVDEMPIAWAFLGLDGAVATLHVEPEHRGKGLALALSKEVMRRGMDVNGVFGATRGGIGGEEAGRIGDWVHTEVGQYNQASQAVMRKIGGEVLTTVMWTVIEMLD
ncbi:Acyl-CoA N-acyltransferase [Penicillium capsulatum]|nr:Acyl-CoA N-acyltransferase [Penicillium capsulatum]